MIPIVPGKGGVDQRQTADAPPEHQQDQYPMRKLSELRRYAERQAYRPVADAVSYRQTASGRSSAALMMHPPVRNSVKYSSKTAEALFTMRLSTRR